MSLVVTVLEAVVAAERAGDLQAAYAEAARDAPPAGLVRSVLLRNARDPTQWRIETTWRSHEALAAMRQLGKPRGVRIFEAAGAEPSLSIFDTIADLLPPQGAA
jgi:hypothetical protein